MNKKIITEIIIAVVVIALGIGGYFYWKKNIKVSEENTIQSIGETSDILNEAATQGILPSINTEDANPLKNTADINPINKSNPFTNTKTNPFE